MKTINKLIDKLYHHIPPGKLMWVVLVGGLWVSFALTGGYMWFCLAIIGTMLLIGGQ